MEGTFPTRPDTALNPIDASTLDRKALSSLKVGAHVTNINNTSSIWKVVRAGGVLKRITNGEPNEASE
jgi:hypothetical protein